MAFVCRLYLFVVLACFRRRGHIMDLICFSMLASFIHMLTILRDAMRGKASYREGVVVLKPHVVWYRNNAMLEQHCGACKCENAFAVSLTW